MHHNRYRFSSKPVHELSGMYDYLYRWYVPELQRWPNRDPIHEVGGINLFAFVFNAPTRFVDAKGLATISFTVNFDRTFDPSQDPKYWDRQMNFLRDAIKKCCSKFEIGCNTELNFKENWMGLGQDRGVGDPGPGQITVTNQQIDDNDSSIKGRGWEGGGAAINPGGPESALAHECGHIAGGCTYPDKDPDHDPDINSIMNKKGGSEPSECWCKSVSSLAK